MSARHFVHAALRFSHSAVVKPATPRSTARRQLACALGRQVRAKLDDCTPHWCGATWAAVAGAGAQEPSPNNGARDRAARTINNCKRRMERLQCWMEYLVQ